MNYLVMKKTICLETNSLRGMGIGSVAFHNLVLLVENEKIDVVIPHFVYREFLKFKFNELLTLQRKARSSLTSYEKKIKDINLEHNDNESLKFDEKALLESLDLYLKEKLNKFNIIEDFPRLEDFRKGFDDYFSFSGLFSGSSKPKEHILDSIILNEILEINKQSKIDVYIGNDLKLDSAVTKEISTIQHFSTVKEFLEDKQVANDLEVLRQHIRGKENFSLLLEFLIDNDLIIDDNLIWELDSELLSQSDTEEWQFDSVSVKEKSITLLPDLAIYFGKGSFSITGNFEATAYYSHSVNHYHEIVETSGSFGLQCEFEVEYGFDETCLLVPNFAEKLMDWKAGLRSNIGKNMYAVAKGREDYFDLRSEINLQINNIDGFIIDYS